jgi:ATP-dependent RNA helicase DDX51/DBP6
VTRLRALIILPTRDLVMQVRETIEELAKGSGLKVSRFALTTAANKTTET